ncbi:MAG: carbohydrate ABC transporter permease [Clostridiales bacterium]|nr:carbohydrate ABC transporter permease [Clostridiales bacterium]
MGAGMGAGGAKKAGTPARRRPTIRRSRGDMIFDAANYALMGLFLLIMLYPLYYTIIASVSDINEVSLGHVLFLPKGFTLDAYRQIVGNSLIWSGYFNSALYTVLGTAYGLIVMVPLAYALSKKFLIAKGFITWFFIFTMYFSGGMIPAYILRVQTLGMSNSMWVMVLGSVSVYNMIVTRTFFKAAVPEELFESAEIDGASQFRCFFSIALPLAVPIIAVMALFFGVSQWNSYFNALLYISDKAKYPLQLVLRNILILNEPMAIDKDMLTSMSAAQAQDQIFRQRLAESMKYSVIFIASAPLLIAYPFVQKHFVKGMLIGSVKG